MRMEKKSCGWGRGEVSLLVVVVGLLLRGWERGSGERGTHLETAKGQVRYRRHDLVAKVQRGCRATTGEMSSRVKLRIVGSYEPQDSRSSGRKCVDVKSSW